MVVLNSEFDQAGQVKLVLLCTIIDDNVIPCCSI